MRGPSLPRRAPGVAVLGPGRDLTAALYARMSGGSFRRSPASVTSDTIAIFPNAWIQNPRDEAISGGFHDVPWEDPGLIKELMKGLWTERGPLNVALERLRSVLSRGRRHHRQHDYQRAIPETMVSRAADPATAAGLQRTTPG